MFWDIFAWFFYAEYQIEIYLSATNIPTATVSRIPDVTQIETAKQWPQQTLQMCS